MSKEHFLEFISRIETMKVIIKLNNPEKYDDLVKKISIGHQSLDLRCIQSWLYKIMNSIQMMH